MAAVSANSLDDRAPLAFSSLSNHPTSCSDDCRPQCTNPTTSRVSGLQILAVPDACGPSCLAQIVTPQSRISRCASPARMGGTCISQTWCPCTVHVFA